MENTHKLVILVSGEKYFKIGYTVDVDSVEAKFNRNINDAGMPIEDFILIHESGDMSRLRAMRIKADLIRIINNFTTRSYASGTFVGCTEVFKYDKDLLDVLGKILHLTTRIKYEVR